MSDDGGASPERAAKDGRDDGRTAPATNGMSDNGERMTRNARDERTA